MLAIEVGMPAHKKYDLMEKLKTFLIEKDFYVNRYGCYMHSNQHLQVKFKKVNLRVEMKVSGKWIMLSSRPISLVNIELFKKCINRTLKFIDAQNKD